jgi:hypothetical protein
MYTSYALEAQARQQEIVRAAHHPSRRMAHELRLARTAATPAGTQTRRARSVLRLSGARLASYAVLAAGLAALT